MERSTCLKVAIRIGAKRLTRRVFLPCCGPLVVTLLDDGAGYGRRCAGCGRKCGQRRSRRCARGDRRCGWWCGWWCGAVRASRQAVPGATLVLSFSRLRRPEAHSHSAGKSRGAPSAQDFMARVARVDVEHGPCCTLGRLRCVATLPGSRCLPAPGGAMAPPANRARHEHAPPHACRGRFITRHEAVWDGVRQCKIGTFRRPSVALATGTFTTGNGSSFPKRCRRLTKTGNNLTA